MDGFTRLVVDNTDGSLDDVVASLGVRGYPSLVFMDTDGNITKVLSGVPPSESILRAADQALR